MWARTEVSLLGLTESRQLLAVKRSARVTQHSRRFLLVVTTGCETPARQIPWVASSARHYDTLLIDYSRHSNCTARVQGADHVVRQPGTFKYDGVWRTFNESSELLTAYDYFALFDDDIDFPGGAGDVNVVFNAAAAAGLAIAQASMSRRSFYSHRVTGHDPSVTTVGRRTYFVEVMAPVFARSTLARFLPLFRGQTHGWSLDTIWSLELLLDAEKPLMGIIDAVQMDHLKKMSDDGPLYRDIGGLAGALVQMFESIDRHFASAKIANIRAARDGVSRGESPPPTPLNVTYNASMRGGSAGL